MLSKNCLQCNSVFTKPTNESKKNWNERHKFCSRDCINEFQKGKPLKNVDNTGKPSWNKGLHPEYLQGKNHHNWKEKLKKTCPKCKKIFFLNPSGERIIHCSLSCAKIGKDPWNKGVKTGLVPSNVFKKGHKPWNWKGDDVGYASLHSWVRRHKGKPNDCKKCGKDKSRYEWANISREYKRDLDDWVSLCTSCHQYADYHKLDLSATTTPA